GHEAGSLLEETAQIFALLVQHTVAPLDRIGPLQKVRLRFPVAADRAKTVKFRHVDGVLEDMAYISVTILDRRMRRTPVALFDAPFRAGDRIGNQGKMVDLAGLEYRLEGGAQHFPVCGTRLAREDVEHLSPDEIGLARHGG